MSDQEYAQLPIAVTHVCGALAKGVRGVLGDDLVGVYLYGSLTFPDSRDLIRDIDYHVIVRRAFTNQKREEIGRLKGDLFSLARSQGLDLDGYYIRLEDTRQTVPPAHQLWPVFSSVPSDESWALHCAHIRAGHTFTLDGPDPLSIYPEPSWSDLQSALWGEVRFVDRAITDNPSYAVLNACRLLYSFATRNVVISKKGAAMWAKEYMDPEWHPHIDAALDGYAQPDGWGEATMSREDVRRLVNVLWGKIAAVRDGDDPRD